MSSDTSGAFYFCGMNERIKIIKENIVQLKVDAIVNAANSSLMGGGGVDGAIHRAGGPAILEECKKIIARQGSCKIGEAVITSGGNLPSKFVIHTVGPVWNGGKNNEAKKLSSCYRNSLKLAVDNGIKTIAFPNISAGIYAYPKKEASEIAANAVLEFLKQNDSIDRVYFVCFDEENYQFYKSLIKD